MKTKKCSDCKVKKPISDFSKHKQHKDGLHSWCKNCLSKRNKTYQKKWRDSGKANITRNKWYENNRDKYNQMHLKSRLKRHYNLTLQQFNQMLEQQKGVCAICRQPETFKNRKYLTIDHNHQTGKIRGLLCHNCNLLLGHSKENLATLYAAISYLKNGKLAKHIA